MENNQIKEGMKVWLNTSNSPQMVVFVEEVPTMWRCKWFDKNIQEFRDGLFSCYELVDSKPSNGLYVGRK